MKFGTMYRLQIRAIGRVFVQAPRILPIVFGSSDERHGGMADGTRDSQGANSAMGVDVAVGAASPRWVCP